MNSTHVLLTNSSCVLKTSGQESSYSVLINETANSTVVGNSLINYFESVANVTSPNSNFLITLGRVDGLVDNLNSTNFNVNGTSNFLMVQNRNENDDVKVLGASFQPSIHGQIVNSENKDNILRSNLSCAVVVSNDSIANIQSMSILIINEPSLYKNIDNSTNDTVLLSPIIVASMKRLTGTTSSINISLYFTPLADSPASNNGTFRCSFYDTNTYRWNDSGCTSPTYNEDYKRHECSCSHTTSFALIWLPSSLLKSSGRTFRAADIASLASQSLSIACFLGILAHAFVDRFIRRSILLYATVLLPLISYGSTSSCITQGIGWLFGPFLSFVSPTGASVLEWFFIVFNGLEGVWSIVAYIIIRLQLKDEQKRVTAARKLAKQSDIKRSSTKREPSVNRQKESRSISKDIETRPRSRRNDSSRPSDDRHRQEYMS
ncbi:hypothetical protein I4U23_007443 [Adineta vaga]|nr:hypothetical protein I4U23_007443 [Adineta vaga]